MDNGWRLYESARVWVAGSRGMVGSAISEELVRSGVEVVDSPHCVLDLRDGGAAIAFAKEMKPNALVLAAAVVGGIKDNMARPADFARDNLLIHANAIHAAAAAGAKAICVVGSACMYPRECPQPMCEESLWRGPLEPTNSAYAAAKLAACETALAYGRQHGIAVSIPIAPNLFGPGDKFTGARAHFAPQMIASVANAKSFGFSGIAFHGSGEGVRELMRVEDFARWLSVLLREAPDSGYVNLGSGDARSVRDWAVAIADDLCWDGKLEFGTALPVGMPVKRLDCSKAESLIGWTPRLIGRGNFAAVAEHYVRERDAGRLR